MDSGLGKVFTCLEIAIGDDLGTLASHCRS